jgi:hypothetical protein
VVLDSGLAGTISPEGSVSRGAAYNTVLRIEPKEELIGIMMSQLRPYPHLNMWADMNSIANQAIVD